MNTLMHFGVKGMRWGVRSAGKYLGDHKAHINAASKLVENSTKIQGSARAMRNASRMPDVHAMGDKELKAIVGRMNLEQQYHRLSVEQTSKGRTYAEGVLSMAGSVLAIAGSAATLAISIQQLKKAV